MQSPAKFEKWVFYNKPSLGRTFDETFRNWFLCPRPRPQHHRGNKKRGDFPWKSLLEHFIKTTAISFTGGSNIKFFQLTLWFSKKDKYPGIILDMVLTWNQHIPIRDNYEKQNNPDVGKKSDWENIEPKT